MGNLSGKVALVTGGGRGIGRSTAIALAGAGADLAVCSRTQAELDEVAEQVKATGSDCFTGVVDVTDRAAVERFCAGLVDHYSRVDILVNNAGGGLERAVVAEADPDLWRRTVEVNLFGTFLFTRTLLEHISDGGKIINVSSGMGLKAGMQASAYNVAKAGVHIFTECLANELWPRRIDINNLVPGPVATSTFNRDDPSARTPTADILARFAEAPPAHFPEFERVKHPDEVGKLALWMALRPEGGPTGQTFSLARRPL
ncbi:MAG: SDR family NAD(P)-dependent oxidoreductase [Chloroflexota bacterium]|nr:SDR family NAD(P)-dependent oxidoreductase [Chloroflexota bacterium]